MLSTPQRKMLGRQDSFLAHLTMSLSCAATMIVSEKQDKF